MAEILDTAQGTVLGDAEQIRTAIYGREVRASIAEALELLYAGQTLFDEDTGEESGTVKEKLAETIANLEAIGSKLDETDANLDGLLENIYGIGVYQDLSQVGIDHKLYMHYADGTTSTDAYNDGVREVVYKGRRYTINEDGTLSPYMVVENENLDFDKLHCGYKYRIKSNADGTTTITSITLFDQNADKISADENGERRQGCILYNDSGMTGFVTDLENEEKVYLSDLLNRISSLESDVEALKNSSGGA
ncbi:hypothetical protein [uncultured Ruminococcus sp.]|uniref:hypothetical protein n=1 Tax=uncultured Ruminococcus sp. TaxID=165186 RepID=UPI002625B912|nr:hypothetical protein [uncultured Ruminococcus sp.]